MDLLTPVTSDTLFAAINTTSNGSQLTELANNALGAGIDKYMDKDYKGAAKDFKRAFGLNTTSENAITAIKYEAMAYKQLGQTEDAIKAYKRGLEIQPDQDELLVALGNVYIAEGRTGEAIEAYEEAVRVYDDTTNRYSLGQAYLNSGRYGDAENQFRKVAQMAPGNVSGYFGLGQTFAAQKKYPEAIEQFERAISKDKTFLDAYAEMGFTYADAGNLDKAKDILRDLELRDKGLGGLLEEYIEKSTQPKILFAWGDSEFPYYMKPKSEVAALNSYLANANSSHTFSMKLQFNKAMDREEIENITNWTIGRSAGNGPGMDYNFGLPIPSTEARVSPIPLDIYYNEEDYSATIRFTIFQNATADATIDPSHIVFSYKGEDVDGNKLDPKFDQFMGFSGSF